MNHTLLDISKQVVIAIVGLSLTLANTADIMRILAALLTGIYFAFKIYNEWKKLYSTDSAKNKTKQSGS